jgi:cephalosporin-C deacetylase-like acetyl esterase
MDFSYEGIKVAKDDNGMYFMIPMVNKLEKIYLEEIFEEFIENGDSIKLSLSTEDKESHHDSYFDTVDPIEVERVRKQLDLRSVYDNPRSDLNAHTYLTNLFKSNPPELAFSTKTTKEHQEWSKKVKQKVIELSGYNMGLVPLDIEEGPETEFNGIILKKYYYMTAPHLKMAAILAKPKHMDKSMPGIICVHGHNNGKICSTGFDHSDSDSYYGIELAKRGYVTLSLDQWGWGERKGKYKRTQNNPEQMYSLTALMLGKTAIGIRAWEVSRSIDFLKKFDFVSDKFAVVGQSGGGTTSAFSSVLDDRIDAAVVSGYFCSWWYSIFSVNHCGCNFIPKIMKYIDFPDLMAARAPKPVFVVSGDNDDIFPQEGVQDAYQKLKKVYELYKKPQNLEIDIIKNTGHKFRGLYSYPWLDKVLLNISK